MSRSVEVAAKSPTLSATFACLRQARPRVQCLTNTVAQAITANCLHALGVGASMATHADEIVAMTISAQAVLINLGTIDAARLDGIDQLLASGALDGRPLVLDPVFVQHSAVRMAAALRIAARPGVIIKGNTEEIAALRVSAASSTLSASAVVVVTGAVDRVEVGGLLRAEIPGGHPYMAQVTGLGCALGAAIAAVACVINDPAEAAVTALTTFARAGERAATESRGPGSFAVNFIDQLAAIAAKDLST